jgi:hypothetical protein
MSVAPSGAGVQGVIDSHNTHVLYGSISFIAPKLKCLPFEEVRSPAIEAHKKVPRRRCSISLVGIHHVQIAFDVCQEITDDVHLGGNGWTLFSEVLDPLHLRNLEDTAQEYCQGMPEKGG